MLPLLLLVARSSPWLVCQQDARELSAYPLNTCLPGDSIYTFVLRKVNQTHINISRYETADCSDDPFRSFDQDISAIDPSCTLGPLPREYVAGVPYDDEACTVRERTVTYVFPFDCLNTKAAESLRATADQNDTHFTVHVFSEPNCTGRVMTMLTFPLDTCTTGANGLRLFTHVVNTASEESRRAARSPPGSLPPAPGPGPSTSSGQSATSDESERPKGPESAASATLLFAAAVGLLLL